MATTFPKAPFLALGAAASQGCGVACEPVASLSGTYDMFANVVEYDGTNLEKFPSDTSPANGASTWAFVITDDSFTVLIDDASFSASADVSTVECGRFSLAFEGPYRADNDLHALSAAGDFLLTGDHLEGTWDYEEEWTSGKDAGTFDATGNVYGTRTGAVFEE